MIFNPPINPNLTFPLPRQLLHPPIPIHLDARCAAFEDLIGVEAGNDGHGGPFEDEGGQQRHGDHDAPNTDKIIDENEFGIAAAADDTGCHGHLVGSSEARYAEDGDEVQRHAAGFLGQVGRNGGVEIHHGHTEQEQKGRGADTDPQKHELEGTGVGLDLGQPLPLGLALGVADAIADVVESGATLREAGLEIIGEPMLQSEAVLIARDSSAASQPDVAKLIARLRGIIIASEYVMVEYNIPRNKLEEACKITPGVESPTISPLSNSDWVAVKAMVKRRGFNTVMDELYSIGGRGIIISEISACRL